MRCVILTLGLMLAPAVALAQGEKSGQVDQSLKKRRDIQPAQEPPEIEIQERRPEFKTPDDTAVKIQVTRFEIIGAVSIPVMELHALVSASEGTEMTLAEIKQEATRITLEYRNRNFALAFAYIPAQEIKGGVVEIEVVEGRVDKILVGGNEHYTAEFMLDHLDALRHQATLSLSSLERSLITLNSYPALRVNATLRPGDTPGSTDLYISAQDELPVDLAFEYNNYGTPSTSEDRLGASLAVHNLFDKGHSLSFHAVRGSDAGEVDFGRLAYTMPFESGAQLYAYWSIYDYESGGPLVVLEPTGDGNTVGLMGSYPVVRDRNTTLKVEFGLEYKNVEQQLIGLTTSDDRIRVFIAGAELDISNHWDGRWIFALQFRKGLGDLWGGLEDMDPDASRLGAGGEFTKSSFQFYRLQRLASWLHVIAKGTYQYVEDPVVVSEQLGIGGPDSVRGFPAFEFMADRGFYGSVEFRLSIPVSDGPESLQIAIFGDWGSGKVLMPFGGEPARDRLTAIGIGVLFDAPGVVNIRVDAGYPESQDPSDDDDPHIFARVVFELQ